jgi:hypothetical protein
MELDFPAISLLANSLLRLVPSAIVFWACLLFYKRAKGTPAALMRAGAGLNLALTGLSLLALYLVYNRSLMLSSYGHLLFMAHLSKVLFAVGLLMQVNRWLAWQDEPKDEY